MSRFTDRFAHFWLFFGCLFFMLGTSWAGGTAPALSLRALQTDDVLRIQLDAAVGSLGQVTLSGGQQPTLRIAVRDVATDTLQRSLSQAAHWPALVRQARVLPGLDGQQLIELTLSRPLQVLDETVVAGAAGRSRWELVLGSADKAVAPGTTIAPSLEALGFSGEGDRLDLTLSGSATLTAEVALSDDATRLIIDLPGVPATHVTRVLSALEALPPAVRSVKPEAGGAHAARLVVELRQATDLVDAGGQVSGPLGQVMMSLVPDARPTRGTASAGRLKALRLSPGDSGGLDLALDGALGARLNVYPLLGPSRIVVDFLGWSPDQVRTAVQAFKSGHPMVRQAVLTDTRLGSARVVLDLASPLAITFRGDVQGSYGQDAREQRVIVGLGAPTTDRLMMAGTAALGDLRMRRDLVDLKKPQVLIRPVALEGASAQGVAADPAGRRLSLMNLFELALERDPRYAATRAEFRAISEGVPQARAAMLPVAAFDFQLSNVGQRITQSAFTTGDTTYGNRNWNLTITQPLYRKQASERLSQSGLGLEQAQLTVLAAEQDLILRVASSYLGLLAARDGVELARAERETTERQLELARTRLQSGLGTIVHVHDTEARAALAMARELEALNREDEARSALKEMVGEHLSGVHGFRADFAAAQPKPAQVEAWVKAALEQNLGVQTRQLAVDIAAIEIRRQTAGHAPTLDAFATVSRQDSSGSIYGSGQDITNREIGIRARIPLYEGGLTSSLVREAVARRDKAEHEREQEIRRTERLARAAYLGVQTNVASLDALRQNVVAQESALRGKLEGFRSGLQTIVNVVDAYRLYFAAQRDYLQTRYDYLNNRLKLKQAVGTLSRNDLQELALLLER